MKTLGELVKEFRERRGLNTTEFAALVGTHRQSIENLEAGTVLMPRYISRLAAAMDADVQDLLEAVKPEERPLGLQRQAQGKRVRRQPRVSEELDPVQEVARLRAQLNDERRMYLHQLSVQNSLFDSTAVAELRLALATAEHELVTKVIELDQVKGTLSEFIEQVDQCVADLEHIEGAADVANELDSATGYVREYQNYSRFADAYVKEMREVAEAKLARARSEYVQAVRPPAKDGP